MKISFLVTYYNQEKYVSQSLDSILEISKTIDWEILVGDDGSDDNTTNVVKEYIKKYPNNIKLYVQPRDKRVSYDSVKRASENRINLLEHCSGDFFCTLDGDDFFLDKNFVDDAIDVFKSNPDISIVMFGYSNFVNNKLLSPFLLPYSSCTKVNKIDYISRLYVPAGACVHRILWDKKRISYIKKIGYFDDNNIVMNTLNFGDIFYINRAIYAYRQNETSVYSSMSYTEKSFLNVLGYDTDKLYLSSNYEINLFRRYLDSIIFVYYFRNNLNNMIDRIKFSKYLLNSKKINGSLLSKLLDSSFPLSSEELKDIRKKLRIIYKSNYCFFIKIIKIYIKYYYSTLIEK